MYFSERSVFKQKRRSQDTNTEFERLRETEISPNAMANKMLIVAILVILGTMATVTDAQATCAQKLVPCAPYLQNATAQPQDDCCDPIREAVANELPCLCNLYSDPTFLHSFNVSIAEALRISRACGITNDLSACNALMFCS
ncbi:hypothetical protein REPUB_Repub08aG0197400 [Reevesia pubescens]